MQLMEKVRWRLRRKFHPSSERHTWTHLASEAAKESGVLRTRGFFSVLRPKLRRWSAMAADEAFDLLLRVFGDAEHRGDALPEKSHRIDPPGIALGAARVIVGFIFGLGFVQQRL